MSLPPPPPPPLPLPPARMVRASVMSNCVWRCRSSAAAPARATDNVCSWEAFRRAICDGHKVVKNHTSGCVHLVILASRLWAWAFTCASECMPVCFSCPGHSSLSCGFVACLGPSGPLQKTSKEIMSKHLVATYLHSECAAVVRCQTTLHWCIMARHTEHKNSARSLAMPRSLRIDPSVQA